MVIDQRHARRIHAHGEGEAARERILTRIVASEAEGGGDQAGQRAMAWARRAHPPLAGGDVTEGHQGRGQGEDEKPRHRNPSVTKAATSGTEP